MNPELEKRIAPLLSWLKGSELNESDNGQQKITLPVIGTISQIRMNKTMIVLRNLFIALLLLQGLRCGAAVIHSHSLLSAMRIEEKEVAGNKMRESIETYNSIMEKGILGISPKEQPQQLFGILGNSALFGTSADDAKPFELDAEIPGGEKIIAIHGSSVEVEKDGKKRTVSVFPDKPK